VKTVSVLFLYDRDISKPWLSKGVERVSRRMESSMQHRIEPRYVRVDFKPSFAEYVPETKEVERWIPFSWMRENVGPLTNGEHVAILCLPKAKWPSDTVVAGKMEPSPYMGTTYLCHLRAEQGEKFQRGALVDLAEDSIFHELLHCFEYDTGSYGVVHQHVNDLEAAAGKLKAALDRMDSLSAIITSLTQRLASLLRR
jgi:hypothetical protein